jgi:hypothetical protein
VTRDDGVPDCIGGGVDRAVTVGYARGRIDDAAADALGWVVPPGENAHTRMAFAILANCMIERGELAVAGCVMARRSDS